MLVSRCLPSPTKGIMIAFFLLLCVGSLYAKIDRHNNFGEIYIIVKESNPKLLFLFELIQKQTSLVFIYDENAVDLSHKIKLQAGEQRLSSLLTIISSQTGFQFTIKGNGILVSSKGMSLQKPIEQIIPPVKGTVK